MIRDVKIKTICCWDTVGSLGIPSLGIPKIEGLVDRIRGYNYRFHDTGLSSKVENAFHALALDEERTHFQPTLWKKTEETKEANLKQCWFPGVHSNIGGGFDDQEIADMTLAWMMQQLLPFLEFDENYLDSIIQNCDVHSEGQWAAGKIYDKNWRQWLFNWGGTRKPGVDDNTEETIHKSVRVRMKLKPEWSNKALRGWTWNEDGYWTNGLKRIAEDELGSLEEKLAGKAVVKDQLKKYL